MKRWDLSFLFGEEGALEGGEAMKVSTRLQAGILAAVLIAVAARLWLAWGPNARLATGGYLWATEKTGFLKGGVSLAVGEILVFKAANGDAGAIKIERMTDDFGLDYVAWFRPASSPADPLSKMMQVRGHVRERYWVTRTAMETVDVKDLGTDQEIRCGKHRFVWQKPTTIYFPDGYEVSATDRLMIDGLSLADPALRWREWPFEESETGGETSKTSGVVVTAVNGPIQEAPVPAPPAAVERFVDSGRGFSYLPPTGWSIESRTGMAFRPGPDGKDENAMASLFVSERAYSGSVDKRVEEFAKVLRKTGMDVRIEEAVPITTESGLEGRKLVTKDRSAGKEAVQIFYFFDGVKAKRRLFFFGGESRSIVVACTIPPERRAEFEPILDGVSRSFRLETAPEKAEAPPPADDAKSGS